MGGSATKRRVKEWVGVPIRSVCAMVGGSPTKCRVKKWVGEPNRCVHERVGGLIRNVCGWKVPSSVV